MSDEKDAQKESLDLMLRYLDGETSADENATLRAKLRSDSEAQRRFARAMRFSGNLATVLLEAEAQAAASASVRGGNTRDVVAPGFPFGRGRMRSLTTFAAGVAVAAGIALVAWTFRGPDGPPVDGRASARRASPLTAPQPPERTGSSGPSTSGRSARLAAVEGAAFRLRGARLTPLLAGDLVAPGDGLTTDRGSVSLDFPNGASVRIGPRSTVAQVMLEPDGAQGDAVFLAHGKAEVTVGASLASALRIVTPHVEARFAAARLDVTAGERLTRIDVFDGKANVVERGTGRSALVEKNQFAVSADVVPLEVRPTPESGGILFVVGEAAREADKVVQRRLARHGRPVRVVEDHAMLDLSAAPLTYDLIVISSTIRSELIDARLRSTAIPIVTWESWLYDTLSMTGPNDEGLAGFVGSEGQLLINSSNHPLAAGLTGRVRVTTHPGPVAFGVPAPTATWVATVPGEPTRAALFAYRRGDVMVDGQVAPAARVGLFLRDAAPTVVTEDGWALFDAAITWALSPREPSTAP